MAGGAAVFGALLVWLVPPNRRALASVWTPPLGSGPPGGHRLSVIAWSMSLGAMFAGPVAVLLVPAVLAVARAGRRRVVSVQYPDPEDLHLLATARRNAAASLAMLVFVAGWVFALYVFVDG